LKLELDPQLGSTYSSASQWARRVTEGWASSNLYCAACSSPRLQPHAANRAVEDYHCPRCSRRVQLKAKQGPLGATVSNSAYEKKRQAIMAGRAPDYCFMSYQKQDLCVTDVLWVPGHFMTLSVVSSRTPLRPTAQRAGWVGSNIHLDLIPSEGKIPLVVDGRVQPRSIVRTQFQRLAFLAKLRHERRGWLTDILSCLDELEIQVGSRFTNSDLYACESKLHRLHPGNHNIQQKIRQQLQVLTAKAMVRRISPGIYERIY